MPEDTMYKWNTTETDVQRCCIVYGMYRMDCLGHLGRKRLRYLRQAILS